MALLLPLACSRTAAPPDATGGESHPDTQLERGTGTRAKGEEATIASQSNHRDAPRPAAPPAVPPPALAPSADGRSQALKEAQEFGVVGLAKEKSGDAASLRPGAPGGGLSGIGRGRLGGVHKSAPMALAAKPATGGPYAPSPRTAARQEEEFNTEGYSRVKENPFLAVKDSPLSTFSVDVDTASYSNMRRFVLQGTKPPADSIRVEEWVNYFSYADPLPPSGEPVEVTSEVTDCPWAPDHRLLRVALATPEIAQNAVPPRNLVFLIDVSGSMQPANKLPLLKRGLALLARQLRPQDTVSMVVYAGASGLALPPTSGAEQSKILGALGSLESGGSTNGAAGIELAYETAASQFKKGGINRVILASDGDFNVGVTSEGGLERLIEEKRKTGVFLTVLGFGEGNLKDATMERLADKGNGQYAYIDDLAEARRVLVQQSGATLVTVAKDVKLQVEFNPARVKSYRLVGYENRLLADRDFNDDKKDAGEMGAGHHVTAFYEIVPAGDHAAPAKNAVDPLKYQGERAPSSAAASDELVTVKVRYKAPAGDTSQLMTRVVKDRSLPLAQTTDNLRFGVAVAQYALTLRGAPGMTRERLAAARSLATGALGEDPRGERREFVALMDKAVGMN